jgi:hypothetical protein
MVLTITGSLSVAQAGREDVRFMLIGALGCNVAWGIIDAVFYLMACLAERGHALRAYWSVLKARRPEEARRLIASALPPVVASVLRPEEFTAIHQRLKELPEPPTRPGFRAEDWKGALGVFLLVFLSTFPVALPFVFMPNTQLALRVSNGIAMAMLLGLGYAYGRMTGYHPWAVGIGMVIVGALLVGMSIALGG